MKFEKLKQLKQKHPSIQPVIDGTPTDLSELVKDQNELEEFKRKLIELNYVKLNITHSEWQKMRKPNCTVPVSTKVTMTVSIKDFLKKFMIEIDVSV